ncbi:endonuclease NucS domain-containing protein [Sporosarcina sp. FSL K6-6792]|uniref:endonuclease NucS domain-containing protein n=1 Tax=Sporosarcina sp. FSL K6-6792 TaxID=2921559 RepID=UPI0030F85B9F
MNYLIPYVDPKRNDGEEDPMFNEFTYGDKGSRGYKLLTTVNKGDYLFFHTSINRKRYITAFYEVETIMPIEKARKNPLISKKYQNPHLVNKVVAEHEVIVFGHPIQSFELVTPLEIDEGLLDQLGIFFDPYTNPTIFGSLTSKLRNWCSLDNRQVRFLVDSILSLPQEKMVLLGKQLSTNEIPQLLERDIEDFVANWPELIGPYMKVKERQYIFVNSNKRLDLLLENEKTGELTIVEIKKDAIDLNALSQLKNYIEEYKKDTGALHVNGVLVGNGVSPYFEEQIIDKVRKRGWKLLNYGWLLSLEEPYKNLMDGGAQNINPVSLSFSKTSDGVKDSYKLVLSNQMDQDLDRVRIHIKNHLSGGTHVSLDNIVGNEHGEITDLVYLDMDNIMEYIVTGVTSESWISLSFNNEKLRNTVSNQIETGEEGWLIPCIETEVISIAEIVRVLFKDQYNVEPSRENKYYSTLFTKHPRIEGIMEELYGLVEDYYRGRKAYRDSEILEILQQEYKVKFENSEGTEILLAYCEASREYFKLSSEEVARMFIKFAL